MKQSTKKFKCWWLKEDKNYLNQPILNKFTLTITIINVSYLELYKI